MPISGFKRTAACALLLCLLWQDTALANLRVGEPVPDFTLDDLAGQPVSIDDFRGKVVLLNFFGYD